MSQKSTEGLAALTFRWVYTVFMARTTEKAANEFVLWVALRHLGVEREILVLRESEQEFFAFPPYAKERSGGFDAHMS